MGAIRDTLLRQSHTEDIRDINLKRHEHFSKAREVGMSIPWESEAIIDERVRHVAGYPHRSQRTPALLLPEDGFAAIRKAVSVETGRIVFQLLAANDEEKLAYGNPDHIHATLNDPAGGSREIDYRGELERTMSGYRVYSDEQLRKMEEHDREVVDMFRAVARMSLDEALA
jgi:hypothetical protein